MGQGASLGVEAPPMTMPMLPGLMDDKATAAAPSALADLLSGLDDIMMGELIAAAEAAGFGSDVAIEAAEEGEEVMEEGEEAAEEAAEDAEEGEEPSEQDVQEVAAQGFDQITEWSASARETLGSLLEQLEGYLTAAQEGEEMGAEPDSIEPLVEKANELIETADEAVSECTDAAKAEDAHACALAALRLERVTRVMNKLVEQAATFAETTTAPEAGFNDEPAVKLWAERTAPKPGPLSI